MPRGAAVPVWRVQPGAGDPHLLGAYRGLRWLQVSGRPAVEQVTKITVRLRERERGEREKRREGEQAKA